MGYSSPWYLAGQIAETANEVGSTRILPFPSRNPICYEIASQGERTYRGVEISIMGSVASTAYAALAVYSGTRIAGSASLLCHKLGTIGITTDSTANSSMASAVGLTGNWFPGVTASTPWQSTSYTLNALDTISGLTTGALAPSSSDIPALVINIPYLNGETHIVIEGGSAASDSVKFAALIRGISRTP